MSSFDGNPQQEVTLLAAIAQRLGADPRYVMGQEEVGLLRLILAGIGNIVEGGGGGASGDMLKSTYDPANIGEQVVGLTAAQQISNKQITGGTIDATPIGGTTPEAGAFTTLNASIFSDSVNYYTQLGAPGGGAKICNRLAVGSDGALGSSGADVALRSDGDLAWSSSTDPSDGVDLRLHRDAANTLALRNGTNAQVFRVYSTYTDGSNYARLAVGSLDGVWLSVKPQKAGTGSYNGMRVGVDDTALELYGNTTTFYGALSEPRWSISSSGHFLAATDNAYDFGALGANRPRDGHFGRDVWVARNLDVDNNIDVSGVLEIQDAARLWSPGAGIFRMTNVAENDFDRLQFGGTTSSFPSLKRSGANIEFRHADDTNTGGTGIILSSPDGTRYRISVDNAGAFTSAAA